MTSKAVNQTGKTDYDGAMNILYIGANHGTSLHRFKALQRLGYDVFMLDPFSLIPSNRWMGKWIYETGAWGISLTVTRRLLNAIADMQFDLVWVDHGQLLGPSLIYKLHERFGTVVNFFHDNILYKRNYRKWRLFRKSAAQYDLIATPDKSHAKYMRGIGATRVIRIFRTADEEVFLKPIVASKEERALVASDVCFVGSWIPGRGGFMAELLRKGVPISIWGDRWQKSKKWYCIKEAWRGPGVYSGNDYVKILKSSKIALGLLSEGDGHTTRSVEIPAVGGLLCAERTTEHLDMYEEDKEAVFWKDADECAEKCLWLLDHPEQRREIAKRGHKRCLKNNYFNEPTLSKIIACAMESK